MNSKKLNISRIMLSVVALLAIIAIGIGVTFAWIEGGDQYSLIANDIAMLNPSLPTSGYVETGTVTLNPTNSAEIKLINTYDNTTDLSNLTFSPVSGNGSDFYLPIAYGDDGTPSYFRKSTTNDLGSKFVSFDFKAKASTKCYVAFSAAPTITVKKDGNTVAGADTSALRFMISNGTTSHIFSTAGGQTTEGKFVTAEGNSFANNLQVKSFDDYTNEIGKTRLFTYNSATSTAETYTLSIWLDCFGSAASLEALEGSTVDINLKLVVDREKVKINFAPITLDCDGNIKANASEGGSVNPTSDSFVIGENCTSTAKITNENYTFEGWYESDTSFTDDNIVGSDLTLTYETPDQETTYYAVFKEKPKHTISVNTVTEPSGTGGTVSIFVDGNEISENSYTGYKDSEVEIVATPNTAEGYRFDGWYKDAECSTEIGTGYKTESQTITIGSADQDYYAKFVKQYTVTIKTMTDNDKTNTAGGYVMLNGTASAYKEYSEKADYNGSKSLYATEATGYTFEGFYKEDGTKLAKTTSPASVSGFTADTTYYANFTTNSYTVTYKIYTNGEADTNGGQIGFDGSTWYSTDKTASVKYNKTTNLYAKAADGYKLDSIYLDGDTSATVSSGGSITVTGDVTYIANFVPSSTGYELRYTDNWTDGLDMNYTDSTQKYVSVTAEFVAGVYDFKIYDGSSWYGKNTSATIIYETNSNLSLDSPGNNNIKFYSYGGTYTFIFGTEDSSLQVIAENNNAITVYFTNSKNWSGTMYCHFWGGSYGTSWPGLAMTYVKTNNQSQKIYKAVIPSNTTGIVFNNNSGSQSPDITDNIVDGKGFYINDSGNVGTYTYS